MVAEQEVQTAPASVDALKIETGPKGFARFFSLDDAQRLQLAFDPDSTNLKLEGSNLRLQTAGNRGVVLQDFVEAASSENPPVLVTPEGDEVSIEAILQLLQQEPPSLETATGPADPSPASGGGSTYGDSLGALIRLLLASRLDDSENNQDSSQLSGSRQPDFAALGGDNTPLAEGPSLPGLFTEEADAVDFNLLNAGSYRAGSQYEALSGDDAVTMPDDAAAAARAGYDASRAFDGGAGNDELTGGGLDDTLEGGAGADVISGGGGNDTASYAGSNNGVSVNLGTDTASGGDAEGDSLSSIENLTGSSHDDTLVGDGGANVLSGGAGNDTLMSSGQSGLSFDGSGAAILPGYNGLPSTTFTIEVEVATTATNDSTAFSYARPGQLNEIILFDMASFRVYIGGAYVNTGLAFNDGAEHRVSVTWDSASGDLAVYDNGELAYSGSLRQGYSLTDGGTLVLGQEQDSLGGGFDPNQSFDGEINSLRIWERALTDEEIAEHHGQDMIDPADPDYASLQAEFLMNEGSGSTLYDSVNGQTANLTPSGTDWTTSGGDTLDGGTGADTLISGSGDDLLIGGDGGDDFRFDLTFDGARYLGPGDDAIQDFTTADKLTLSSVLDETGEGDIDLDDLLGHISVSDSGPGGDVTLSFDGGGSITLLGIGTGDLNSLDALTEASFQIEVSV